MAPRCPTSVHSNIVMLRATRNCLIRQMVLLSKSQTGQDHGNHGAQLPFLSKFLVIRTPPVLVWLNPLLNLSASLSLSLLVTTLVLVSCYPALFCQGPDPKGACDGKIGAHAHIVDCCPWSSPRSPPTWQMPIRGTWGYVVVSWNSHCRLMAYWSHQLQQ